MMKLIFKQRFFSWFDSYDIYHEDGSIAYTVKGQLAWGHCLKIYDCRGEETGTVQEKVLTLLPQFLLYEGQNPIGRISKEFSLFQPRYNIDFNGWHVEGNFLEWDYRIQNASGMEIAIISKEILNWTDTYVLNIRNPEDALYVLMLVLAIDAEKCSRDD